jgi:hypothetical protein
MSAKHTPAPWNVKPLGVITGGPLVEYVRGSSQPQIGMATLPANVAPDEDPAEVQVANARLMGAALCLLEALKEFVHEHEAGGLTERERMAKARAAITKAEAA